MTTTISLYRVVSEEPYPASCDILRGLDVSENTENGTNLHIYTSNCNDIQTDVFTGLFTYMTEEFIQLPDDEYQYYPLDHQSSFVYYESGYFGIYRKRATADRFAARLNKYAFREEDVLRKIQFSEDFMLGFMSENRHQTSNAYMGNLDTPGAYGTSIYGGNVEGSQQYSDSLDHRGEHSFVRMKLLPNGHNVGLSRKIAQITFYTNIELLESVEFVQSRLLPLI